MYFNSIFVEVPKKSIKCSKCKKEIETYQPEICIVCNETFCVSCVKKCEICKQDYCKKCQKNIDKICRIWYNKRVQKSSFFGAKKQEGGARHAGNVL